MIALLTYANRRVVEALLKTPEKITVALVVFSELDLADSSTISKKLFCILVHGRTLIVEMLLESPEKLSNSIRVFSQNNITDPGVILMIMERADDSVIQVLMQDTQKLAEVVLSAVGTRGIQSCSTVLLMNEIQVTTLDQQTHTHTHTYRLTPTHTQIFIFSFLLKLLCPDILITFSLYTRNISATSIIEVPDTRPTQPTSTPALKGECVNVCTYILTHVPVYVCFHKSTHTHTLAHVRAHAHTHSDRD